ncbi:NAD(P)H-quinone oxidoreductase subunit J, chloroplastic [Candidatus Entotheonellaceae bacterium PAL068K]
MTPAEIHQKLQERFGEQIVEFNGEAADPYVVVAAPAVHDIAEYLRHEADLHFDSLMCLSGVDYGPEKTIGVVYHLASMTQRHKITLRVEVPRQDGSLPTVCDIWRTADWHEREAYDLYGMRFDHHPDLRRILLPDDWQGNPMLKDYQVQEFYHGIKVPYVGDPPDTGREIYRTQEQGPL